MERHSTRSDGKRVLGCGQDGHDETSVVTLAYLAETMLAAEEQWASLPEPYAIFGREFLDALLAGAGHGN